MKKILLLSLVIFAGLFVVITITKNKPATGDITEDGKTHTDEEKKKVIAFWEHYRKATDLRMEGAWEEAGESYRRALTLNPSHGDALYYLGNMYMELSRYQEAEETWLRLAQINPENSRAFLQLGSLYLSSEEFFDIDKAERACRQALRLNKEETGPVLFLGEVNLVRGDLAAAAADFDAVTASNFKSKEAYFLGGYIAWKNRDAGRARELYTLAVRSAKPQESVADKVIGEGDTKPGKGFGAVTSKSVFRKFTEALKDADPENPESTLHAAYRDLDAFLTELKSRIP